MGYLSPIQESSWVHHGAWYFTFPVYFCFCRTFEPHVGARRSKRKPPLTLHALSLCHVMHTIKLSLMIATVTGSYFRVLWGEEERMKPSDERFDQFRHITQSAYTPPHFHPPKKCCSLLSNCTNHRRILYS